MESESAGASAALVVVRDGVQRLRLGFSDGEGVLATEPLPEPLAAGTVVAHRDGVVLRNADGKPILLAEAGTALAKVYAIAARAELRLGFAPEHHRAAEAIVAEPRTDDPELRDLRSLPFVTIDYERSRDLDQAVYVEPTDEGFEVYYALADAASYIGPHSPLLLEALERGTSFYMPGLTVPMLPRSLSEGVVSLNPEVDRRALVFRISVAADGHTRNYDVFNAVIHSRAKLTYDGVQAFIDDPGSSPLAGQDYSASMNALAAVGRARIAESSARDVVRYDRVSAALRLSAPSSKALSVRRETRNGAQKWNEQISLLTNTVGAEYLATHVDPETGLAGLFRVHPRPDERELESFARSIADLVKTLGLAESWLWDRASESLASYIDRLPDSGEGARLACALQRQAMIMGSPSTFTTEAAPHFGVGAPAYSRFSSPMREVVGIVTMQIALAQRQGQSLADIGLTEQLIDKAARAGNRANKLQKRLTRRCHKLAIDQLFAAENELPLEKRPRRTGTVLGLTEHKIYLQLDDPPIEVKLYVADQNRLLGTVLELANRFELSSTEGEKACVRVGDGVAVHVQEYVASRERWVLRLDR